MGNHSDIYYAVCALAALFLFAFIAITTVIPEIDAWEKSDNYPYGKLCDVWNKCY
jgi:hypothetical protein